MNIGYHYTSRENWKKIKKKGLIPYPIDNEEMLRYYPDGLSAIWCWEYPLCPESEAGSIIYQVGTKKSTNIVKLRIKYTDDEVLHHEGRKVNLNHHGSCGNWRYHQDEKAILLPGGVKPEMIELIKEYDIINKLTT